MDIRCVVVDVKNGVSTVECDLDTVTRIWEKYIGTTLLDRTVITIGDEQYLAVVDDVGKLRKEPITSVIWKDVSLTRPVIRTLVGNVVIHKIGEDGELSSLSDSDIKNIKAHTVVEDGYEILESI